MGGGLGPRPCCSSCCVLSFHLLQLLLPPPGFLQCTFFLAIERFCLYTVLQALINMRCVGWAMFCPLQSSYYIWSFSFVCCDLHEGQDMLYNPVGIVMPQGACMMLQIQEVVEQQCPAVMRNESTIVCHAVWLPDSTSRWEHLLLSLGLNVSNLLLPEVSRRWVQFQHASIHVGALCLHDFAIVARHSDRMHGSSATPQKANVYRLSSVVIIRSQNGVSRPHARLPATHCRRQRCPW